MLNLYQTTGQIIPVNKQYYQELEVSNAFNKQKVKELELILKFRKNEGLNFKFKKDLILLKKEKVYNCKLVKKLTTFNNALSKNAFSFKHI